MKSAKSIAISDVEMGFLVSRYSAKFRRAMPQEVSGPRPKPIIWVVRLGKRVPYVCETYRLEGLVKMLLPEEPAL